MKVRGRCHCRHCQMLSGTAFRAGIPAPAEGFRILAGKPRRYVKVADSGARRVHALSFSEKFLGSFARSLHGRLQRVAPSERIESRVNAPEPDETLRVAEVVVEDREVAPRRVVRDVAGRGIEARRRASGRKLARQVADLFRRVVIFKGQRQRQKGSKVPRRCVVEQRALDFLAFYREAKLRHAYASRVDLAGSSHCAARRAVTAATTSSTALMPNVAW